MPDTDPAVQTVREREGERGRQREGERGRQRGREREITKEVSFHYGGGKDVFGSSLTSRSLPGGPSHSTAKYTTQEKGKAE